MRRLAVASAAALIILGGFASPVGAATPAPTASATPAPAVASSPTPLPSTVAISGQLVDLERGYVVFSTGDAFRLASGVTVVDATTLAPFTSAIEPGMYATVVMDTASASVTTVRLSRAPLHDGIPAPSAPRQLVTAASPRQPNPELAPPPVIYHSQLSATVRVTIDVDVPPETPYTDDVYVATDSSGWNAQAIKMQRVDGRRFRIQVDLKPGTQFHYLFTRGSWQTVERDRSGLKRAARLLAVIGGDSMVVSTDVYRWADIP